MEFLIGSYAIGKNRLNPSFASFFSWGTYWGENGWARIAMGPGELGLSQVWCDWATPKVLEGSPPYERFFSSQPAT